MRNYSEPTARNLLRRPLILGVPLIGLILLSFVVLTSNLLGGQGRVSSLVSLSIATIGYGVLRFVNRVAKNGWEETFVFKLEKLVSKKMAAPEALLEESRVQEQNPDTLELDELVQAKDGLREWLRELKNEESKVLFGTKTQSGFELFEFAQNGFPAVVHDYGHAYSLYQLPVRSDPLWLNGALGRISGDFAIAVRIQGLDFWKTKARIEQSRRSNARDGSRVSNIDSEVSFEESSRVLEGLSRGEEKIYEVSLVIWTKEKADLDPEYFCEERLPELSMRSVLGLRKRLHRSFLVRECTATDLIPNLLDPKEPGTPILQTRRGSPLYFSPLDSRLEALHWLVVGASGSGKSFFTGLMLKRLIEQGEKISVLFVDHGRSFRRLVRSKEGRYIEPETHSELNKNALEVIQTLNQAGIFAGIELSDLDLTEKKAAAHFVLHQIENFLKTRDSVHPIYIVLDECWNFMRDEPVLVQRAFREFRKLNGAAVAITQSLEDFLTDEAGQSIYQNAPVRILLRQGADVSEYQGVLNLNSREMALLKTLQQQKGRFAECLIKTPFLSRLGRLYPTDAEHDLLRTDNLRQELIQNFKTKAAIAPEVVCP